MSSKTTHPHISWLLVALALSGGLRQMWAQPATVTLNDSLSQVQIFGQSSPDFAKIASELGVSATLSTLGAGADLVAAIRNDSGQAVELRVLWQLTKGGRTIPFQLVMGQSVAPGGVALTAPPEVGGALLRLLNAGRPGLVAGSTTVQNLNAYQGATVTVSVDSATLADGTFIGADTQNIFNQLVAEATAKRKFFRDLSGWVSAGQTQAQIKQALSARQSSIEHGSDLAAIAESDLCSDALIEIEQGMASLANWAAKENAVLAGKPSIHR